MHNTIKKLTLKWFKIKQIPKVNTDIHPRLMMLVTEVRYFVILNKWMMWIMNPSTMAITVAIMTESRGLSLVNANITISNNLDKLIIVDVQKT